MQRARARAETQSGKRPSDTTIRGRAMPSLLYDRFALGKMNLSV